MIIRITTITAEHGFDVSFPYDEHAVEMIRSVPGRRWDAARKVWKIPARELDDTARMFLAEGAQVFLDGEPYKPPAKQSRSRSSSSSPPPSSNPFVTVFGALPGHLRQPMYRAMSRVLHPDVGGNTDLMQKLNAAWQVYERSAG